MSVHELRRRREALGGPSVAKTRAPSWDELCEKRAKDAFWDAVERGGVRATARRAELDERTIRDKRDGGRSLLLKDAWKLPREGGEAIVDHLLAWLEQMPPSETGT